MIDWRELLGHWSTELLGSDLAERVAPLPTSAGWLGYAPTTDAEVAAVEARLGLRLPPSYVAFLKVTNGWRRTTFAIDRLRPAAEVARFRVENENWADTYADFGDDEPDRTFYDYPGGSAAGYRASHMRYLVQVSDVDDGVLLLNPRAVTPDGEWEAWFFANWVPGAERYPSFAHLMVGQFRSFRKVQEVPPGGWEPPALPVPPPTVKRKVAKPIGRSKAAKQPPVTLDALLQLLGSEDEVARSRAVRTLGGKVGGRGVPRLDLVGPLSDLFGRSGDPAVRAVCISTLITVAADGPGPPPLLAALSDPDPGVVLSGISALDYFPDPRAVGPLCRFVASGMNPLFADSAMSALADLGDPAAVPTLAGVMTDTANPLDQSFAMAGVALGRIAGPSAVEVLIAGLAHADARVRLAAVVGLDVSGDPRSPAQLDRMATDPDEAVRLRASHRTGR